jgi:YHS domain-containing protein
MADKQIDPVCGMEVDPNNAAGESQYQGKTYYFCAPGCKREFDRDPEKYVNKTSGQATPH